MRVLYLTGRETGYPRNDVLLRAFRRLGQVKVFSIKVPGSRLWNSIQVALKSLPHLLFGQYDLVFVGFFGHLIMLPVGVFARKPVLFDAFISTFDTLCYDRGSVSPASVFGRAAHHLDQTACRLASRTLLDTLAQKEYFTRNFKLAPDRIHPIPVGCNEDLFVAKRSQANPANGSILYYSTYMPLHGVDTVVEAAALLQSEKRLQFKLIGAGQLYAQTRKLVEKLKLSNLSMNPPVPLSELPTELAHADICLGGHFGRTEKAGRVIPGKIYQILAMARPLIAADSPANRELLSHGKSAFLCPPADPEALAAAVLTLHGDIELREGLAVEGRNAYERSCSEAVITNRLSQIIDEMLGHESREDGHL